MAGTNITNLLEIIQRKIDAADASTATQDLLYLLSAVRQGDGSALELYDSVGAFPDLTDSAADTEMIAYKGDSDRLYFNVGVWKGKSLPAGGDAAHSFQGTIAGYMSGGNPIVNTIQKFSFTSDENATDVGDLTIARQSPSGQSSNISGYTSGGYGGGNRNTIDKFSFASGGNASDVGDLTVARQHSTGQSSSTSGYASAGPPASSLGIIEKFPFSTDENATNIGTLTEGKYFVSGQSSQTHGYVSGGRGTAPTGTIFLSTIDKFPFTVDENATDVADLASIRTLSTGQSSGTHGYTSGGETAPIGSPAPSLTQTSTIEKFPFSSDANATEVGNLSTTKKAMVGQSSNISGYTSGGDNPSPGLLNTIDKFPFASDGTASDVGDLLAAGRYAAGQQY
jgi:hypothetical protein